MSHPPAPPLPSRKKAAAATVSFSSQVAAAAEDADPPTAGRAKGAAGRKRPRSGADNDTMLHYHPSSTPTRVAVAEESTSPRPPDGPHPSATEGHTKNVRSASEAVQKAEESVARAEAQVLELAVTCAALNCKALNLPLKTKVEDVLSRWKQVNETVKEMHRTTAQAIHDSASTVEIAERKLKEAKAELEKAKAELEKAEVKLEKAKLELKEAEVKIEKITLAPEKARTKSITVTDLANEIRKAIPSLDLRILSLSDCAIVQAQGMVKLVDEMANGLGNSSDLQKIKTMQQTIAFALACSSGVGKTFFSLAAAKLLPNSQKKIGKVGTLKKTIKVGTLYLGFNSCMPVRDNEKTLLQEAPSYQSVERVLLRRLLIQLECLLVWKRKRSGPVPFTFDKYGLQHVVKMDGSWLEGLPLLSEASLEAARKQALQLLTEVQKKYDLTHLMLVIDEGQKLDELIPPSSMPKEQGGARCALRWTRQLQLDACLNKCGLLCFGLMTGVDPQTSLADKTDGINHPLRHMPMELDEFQKLTKAALAESINKKVECLVATASPTVDTKNYHTPSNEQVNVVAAYCYPEARTLLDIQVDDEYKFDKSSVEEAVLLHGVLEEGVRRRIVIGAVAGLTVDDTDWARTVPSTWAPDGRRTPCPSYAMLTGRLLKGIFSSGGDNIQIKDCFEFEKLAGETLRLLIWVCSELSRTASHPFVDVMNGIFLAQKDHSSFRLKVIKAFPATVKGYWSQYPEDAKGQYYPSSALGTHNDAFAVGKKSHPLAGTFKECTDQLYDAKGSWSHEEGNTLFFRCGGSAPIDFVILHKTSISEWQLTLADAKHTSNNTKSSNSIEMAERADLVFRYLAYQLKQVYGVTLTWGRTVLLITNATCGAPLEEVPKTVGGKQPGPVTIVRLMPSTFNMRCVTEFLFALPSTAGKEKKK